jgi:polyhydroxyalkanoate synthase
MMNLGFLLLNPARLMIDKYVGFMENCDKKQFVENFVRMDKWIFDSPDLPGEVFRQFVRDCYQGNKLLQNKMEVGGQRVDLKKLTMPLLNIYGKFDHLVPPEACDQLVKKVGSKDTEDICLNTGHIGIYVSSKYQEEFAPKIARWLKERDQTPKNQPPHKTPTAKKPAVKSKRKQAVKKTTASRASSKTKTAK